MVPSCAAPSSLTWTELRGLQRGNLPREYSSLTFSPSPNHIQKQDLLPLFPSDDSSPGPSRRNQRRPAPIPLAKELQPNQKSIEILQNLFPLLPSELLKKELVKANNDVNRCAEILLEMPNPQNNEREREKEKELERKNEKERKVFVPPKENPSIVKRRHDVNCSVCDVQFGQDLDEEAREKIYRLHRAPMRKLTQQKEKLSKLASRYYSQGQKVLAKEASDEKEKIQRELASLADSCSFEIFSHFNYKYLDDPTKIDVHGLHSEEASYYVIERLSLLSFYDVTTLTIITGVGNHSLGRSIIHPAIVNLLEEEKLAFDQSRAGQIVVRVRH